MTSDPDSRTPRSYVGGICSATHEWLHHFRSMNGEPYVFALVTDDAAVSIRPEANTEAHFRAAVLRGECGGERERCRWQRDAWVTMPSGPDFDQVSDSLKIGAWQPDFATFRLRVLESVVLALADSAARGVFGKRDHPRAITLFASIDHAADASTLELSSALRLNSHVEAKTFAVYSGRSNSTRPEI